MYTTNSFLVNCQITLFFTLTKIFIREAFRFEKRQLLKYMLMEVNKF